MTDISLENFGSTPQEAIRAIIREFRNHGWHDDGSVAKLVRFLGDKKTTSPTAAAHQISSDFLAANNVTRATVAASLTSFSTRS